MNETYFPTRCKLDRQKYADCMSHIRYRLIVIDRFLSRQTTTGYEISDMESICLQFRKVFELIAMASLCPNRKKCAEVKKRFDRLWEAAKILKFVESLNPHFYPVPVTRTFGDTDPPRGVQGSVSHIADGFLNREELIDAHGRCGRLLHAENPYRNRFDPPDEWFGRFQEWKEKTRKLLSLHNIQPVDTSDQWWIDMRFDQDRSPQVFLAAVKGG